MYTHTFIIEGWITEKIDTELIVLNEAQTYNKFEIQKSPNQ